MKTLLLWGDAPVSAARARAGPSSVLVAWRDDGADRLRAEGLPARSLSDYLGPGGRDALDEAAMAWTKAWGKHPLQDGRSFREGIAWKGASLWWLAELYLYHSTACPGYVRTIETLHRVLEAERPDEVEAVGLARVDALLVERTCTARGVLFHGRTRVPRTRLAHEVRRASRRSRWNALKARATAWKGALAGAPAPPSAHRATVLFLSHAAFWRERPGAGAGAADEDGSYEHYFDRLLPGTRADPHLTPFVVAVGPRAAFRKRGLRARVSEWMRLPGRSGPYVHVNRYFTPAVLREVRRATAEIRRAWQALRAMPGLRASLSYREVSFADLAGPALAETLLLQLPWAVRCYEEMAAVLRAVRPSVVCLYAESSGWGRAALLACRAANVPTVALQHGILYPKYFSYRHGPDESDCPRPDRTAVFGASARRLLMSLGGYEPESLVLTGSPKFDQLLEGASRWDRASLRRKWGVGDGDRLVIVASRFRAIRDTHQSIGSAFAAFVSAVESLPGVQALVKPHPAEPANAYDGVLGQARTARVRVVAPGTDLMELMHAADALVTVESLSAVEALVLGRPVLVLNMPSHLRELVETGVALGVAQGQDPRAALEAILFDGATATRLQEARQRYLSELALGVDGRATERILQLLRETARPPGNAHATDVSEDAARRPATTW